LYLIDCRFLQIQGLGFLFESKEIVDLKEEDEDEQVFIEELANNYNRKHYTFCDLQLDLFYLAVFRGVSKNLSYSSTFP